MMRVCSSSNRAYVLPLSFVLGLVTLGVVIVAAAPQPVAQTSSLLRLPQAVDLDPHPGVFETALVAMETSVDLGNGVMATAQTFNGVVPGPEIRLKVGDRVIVHFTNNLAIPSSIHWHGIELTNRSDGTGITQAPVPPGGTFTYEFQVPRPGIYFYHSHIDPTNPTFKGYYGSLIVEDPAEQKLIAKKVLPKLKDTITLVLGDTTVCKTPGSNDADSFPADPNLPWAGNAGGLPPFPGGSGIGPSPVELCETQPLDDHGHFVNPVVALPAGAIPNIQPTFDCNIAGEPGCPTGEGQLVVVNGKVPAARAGHPGAPGALAPGAAVIDVKSRQGVRLQVASATAIRYYRLRLTDQNGTQIPLLRVGGQGGLLDHARLEGGTQGALDTQYDPGEILVAVSERQDVVFVAPEGKRGDVFTLWTLDYQRTGQTWAKIPTVPVAHFRIEGPAFNNHDRITIAAGDPLRAHPAINTPVESLKALAIVDHFLDPSTFVPPESGTPDETIALTAVGKPGLDGSIDGHIFDAGDPAGPDAVPHVASTRWTVVGHLLELTLKNDTAAHHPWHPHGFSIQPVRFVDNATAAVVREFDYNEFVDSVDIPPDTSLVYRVRMDDRPFDFASLAGGAVGRWAMHCHILFHAGIGMISEFVVKATP
jgi:FtsP/CotA-like multicopper oxidase with cupredoxin domain